jgi:5'-nucleotidase
MKTYHIPSDLRHARILISNDDGIHSEGIAMLEQAMREFSDDVWVVAPLSEQSGAGHSLTLHQPLRVAQHALTRFSVSGTPTDCVLLAAKEILPKDKPIDLIVSGINHGDNMAEHVTYSGTIAATMEGTLLGIPSIAFSRCMQGKYQPHPWETSLVAVRSVISQLRGLQWDSRTLLSVNIPDCTPDEVRGIRVVRQGSRDTVDAVEHRTDPRGRSYYWIGGTDYTNATFAVETDCDAVAQHYIALTPISLDLTHYPMLNQVASYIDNINTVPSLAAI